MAGGQLPLCENAVKIIHKRLSLSTCLRDFQQERGQRMRDCSVRGCTKSASGQFGSMCAGHQQRNRRHGDARQDSIRYAEIKPYVVRVEKLIERDKSGKIENGLDKLVAIVREYAEGIVSDFEHGRAMNKHKVAAAKEILTVFLDFTPAQCASVRAGMYLFQDVNEHRFASDRGFTFELVRRFRSISDANIGLYEDGYTGRVRRAYKEIPPKTIEQLGAMLIEGFKRFVAHVRLHEQRKAELEREARALQEEGFASVQEESHD